MIHAVLSSMNFLYIFKNNLFLKKPRDGISKKAPFSGQCGRYSGHVGVLFDQRGLAVVSGHPTGVVYVLRELPLAQFGLCLLPLHRSASALHLTLRRHSSSAQKGTYVRGSRISSTRAKLPPPPFQVEVHFGGVCFGEV